jgi:hypothetical protein
MKAYIHQWVQSCVICQQAKPDRQRSPGLLQPLPVPTPTALWHTISMDFIEGLPKSQRYNCILVVVDLFSKYAHFVPLSHPFTAVTVATTFMQQVYKAAWHAICHRLRSRQNFHQPFLERTFQTGWSPTEWVNHCLETYLRCFVHACPSKWSQWLATEEFWYNTSHHSSIGRSPFEALYGYTPKHFGTRCLDSTSTDLSSFLQDRELIHRLLQQHLHRAKQRMKSQADKARSERAFSVGDLVFLRVQPYMQTSLATRTSQKLSFRYFGPYKILARVGTVAYRLQLPASSTIHPMFHMSQLKRFIPPSVPITHDLLDAFDSFQVPLAILSRRIVTRGVRAVRQVLIHWSSLPTSPATWEDLESLQQRFSSAPAWGQAGANGGRDVSSHNSGKQEVLEASEATATRPKRVSKPNSKVVDLDWV